MRQLLRVGVFPVVFVGGVGGVALGMAKGLDPAVLVAGSSLAAAALIAAIERLLPYEARWNASHGDLTTDLLHMLLSTTAVPELCRALLFGMLTAVAGSLAGAIGVALWPGGWPLVVQLLLALLIGEFGQYWWHRALHEVPWLWRLHAVHHSAPRLYWLNAGRFHPLDNVGGYLVGVAPLVLLGASVEVLGLFTLVTAIHGMFQHANIDLRLGPLNWVFSMAELHRWHHVRDAALGNTNYGANLIVWDVVFGTRYLPGDRLPPSDIGIEGMPGFPTGYLAHLAVPFRWKAVQRESVDPGPAVP